MKTIVFSLAVILVVAGLLISGMFVSYSFGEYGHGERVGLLNKISQKGLICKTYEGYILVGNGQNVQPETFYFTVKDEAVAKELSALNGKVVSLTYNQKFITSPCWGDSDYDVVAVKLAQ